MKLKSLLFMFTLALMVQGTMFAAPDAVNLEDTKEGTISLEDASSSYLLSKEDMKSANKLERKQKRTQKKMARVQKFMNSKMGKKMMGGLDDPVDKFFWFWVIGWGAAIVLAIIGAAVAVGGAFSGGFGIGAILILLGWLAGLAGTISLIIWLVKKFS